MVVAEWVLLTLSFASGGGPCRPAAVPGGGRAGRFHGRGSGRGQRDFDKSPAAHHAPGGVRLTASGEQPPAVS
jgi:hypothetical protein